jgi:protein involved in temperature-dependent protein secretion
MEVATPPQTVDELLAQGFFGTAVELLEKKIKAQPQDFELRLKLAEVHAANCKNFQRAEKIIRQMGTDSSFSPQQIELARAKFKDWRAATSSPHGMA